jgi:hypothetical protein
MEDKTVLLEIIMGLLSVVLALVGFNLKTHKSEFDKLKEDHSAHKLKVSENYALKSDLNAARLETNESLKRVYDKIEVVDDKLSAEISDIPERVLRLLQRSAS